MLGCGDFRSRPACADAGSANIAKGYVAQVVVEGDNIDAFSTGLSWGLRVESIDIREQYEHIGAHEHGDEGCQTVIVAKADLVGGYRVVLVDDRQNLEA